MYRMANLPRVLRLLVAAGAFAAALAAPWFFSWAYWQEVFTLMYWQKGGVGTSRSEVVRNLGLAFIALGALIVGSIRAWSAHRQARAANDQARIADQGHITERFSRATEQLGHDRVAVRIGGLYALKRIAEDSVERDHLAVMDVITNFIRQPPYAKEQREAAERDSALRAFRIKSAEEKADSGQNDGADQTAVAAVPPPKVAAAPPPKPESIDCPDVVAAIQIIQGRNEDQKAFENKRGYRLLLFRASLSYFRLPEVDLHIFALARADLMGASLRGANLRNADLGGARLTDANLIDADLSGAILADAGLDNAKLIDADLTEAILANASLGDTYLAGADLTGADLTSAHLAGAKLYRANLTNSNLYDAELAGASLSYANLRNADLGGARLMDADLEWADLTGADLTDAKLYAANLSRANLTGAEFTDANFTDADLSDADFTGAHLTDANNLTQDQLDWAYISKGGVQPTLPEGLKPPHKVCVPRTR